MATTGQGMATTELVKSFVVPASAQGMAITEQGALTMPTAESIYKLLTQHRFTLSHEKTLQTEISVLLASNGIAHVREFRLSDNDCIDFIAGNVGLEVKLKGAAMAIFRQCERYCGYPEVGELILITGRTMGLPREIGGKPAYLLPLGRGWL